MTVRWGIDGTGGIARAMVDAIRAEGGGEVVAVASRSLDRAVAFAAELGVPEGVEGTKALAERVDAIYVAGVNTEHSGSAITALEAGVAVLCEKPMAITGPEAAAMVEVARRNRVLLVEAMWMRFLPLWPVLEEMLPAIGPLRYLRAEFGIPADPDPRRRWFDPGQGGGALLDVGIYPLTLACLLAGEPLTVAATEVKSETGVDAQFGATMSHQGGALSVIGCSFVADGDVTATLAGPLGRLTLEAPFHHTSRINRWQREVLIETRDVPNRGFVHEVAEFHRCLAEGLTETPLHPLEDTLMVMRTMDRIRSAAVRG